MDKIHDFLDYVAMHVISDVLCVDTLHCILDSYIQRKHLKAQWTYFIAPVS